MALQVHYRYKYQVPDESQRKAEGVKVRKKYPAKIPVSFSLIRFAIYSCDSVLHMICTPAVSSGKSKQIRITRIGENKVFIPSICHRLVM